MFASPRNVYLVVVLIALVPGVVSWWSGRRLARRADDPALPEQLAAHRRRNGAMFGVALVVPAFVASFSRTDIGFPIVLGGFVAYAGLIAAAYPLRCALYEDRWSFLAYFLFFPRTILGLFGFWMVLAALPGIAALARERDWSSSIIRKSCSLAWRCCSGTPGTPTSSAGVCVRGHWTKGTFSRGAAHLRRNPVSPRRASSASISAAV